jgi:hypothetical protein
VYAGTVLTRPLLGSSVISATCFDAQPTGENDTRNAMLIPGTGGL